MWKRSASSKRRPDVGLSAVLVAGLMEAGKKFRTRCKNGKNCPHRENCVFADCQTKPSYVQELEKEFGRNARGAIRLLNQRDEKIAELTAEIKALRAASKSHSKKRSKKSTGAAAAAAADNVVYPSASTLSHIIYYILRESWSQI